MIFLFSKLISCFIANSFVNISPVLGPLSCHATPGRVGHPLSPALRDRRGGPELDYVNIGVPSKEREKRGLRIATEQHNLQNTVFYVESFGKKHALCAHLT